MSVARISATLAKPLQVSTVEAVGPYLHAALSVLQTLEREIRAAAVSGSREEISAEALKLRASELEAQIAYACRDSTR